ncbi:MAG: response regulator [Deltaproteobacteria bacterium]|nr:response regulator [Deltaproteobacteria bacterium]
MDGHRVNILAVDDEADILRLLGYNLRKEGFSVIEAKDGPEAIELARNKRPDIILLDIMLPDMDGTEVLKRLKRDEMTSHMPVIMLTAKGEEVDRIVGLELGAEDYITKPFSPRELILRIKAVLKRKRQSPAPVVLAYGELVIDPSRHRVTVKGNPVTLTGTEFKLLKTLFEARGRVLSRDTLLNMAWGRDCFVTPRTVDTHIRRLRGKLRGLSGYVETVRGVGYRFTEG